MQCGRQFPAAAARLCHGHGLRRHKRLYTSRAVLVPSSISAPRRHEGACVVCSRGRERRRVQSLAAARPPSPSDARAGRDRGGALRRAGDGGADPAVPLRVLLPTLGQNGTLVLRSASGALAEVRLVSQWRDDALLEVVPLEDGAAAGDRSAGEGAATLTLDAAARRACGPLRLTSRPDGVATSMGRRGALVEVDVPRGRAGAAPFALVATVPEKLNVTCVLARGDIDAVGKLEGDAHLATADGAIAVAKLRGHTVTLDATGRAASEGGEDDARSPRPRAGTIHVRKAVEARTVRIDASARVRARMVNGSDVAIRVAPPTPGAGAGAAPHFHKLDADDEGAAIDVGSLYVSGAGASDNEARLTVQQEGGRGAGLVRVKSSHGHVTVHARIDRHEHAPPPSPEGPTEGGRPAPLIDLGGVNGSCDVTLEARSAVADPLSAPMASAADDGDNGAVAARVHFDSLAPESISTLTIHGDGAGRASVTVDRKAEAEVRLLSAAGGGPLPPGVDAHALTSDEAGEVRAVLLDVEAAAADRREGAVRDAGEGSGDECAIAIRTDAYEGTWGLAAADPEGGAEGRDAAPALRSHGMQYTQGTLKNRSGEPPSRFDVQSRGKINIDGAASQALHGFRGAPTEEDSAPAPHLPLLAVASEGGIRLETLSWFGSIARRYGLEEERKDLGQRATRSDRLDE